MLPADDRRLYEESYLADTPGRARGVDRRQASRLTVITRRKIPPGA
jgi:hypothetical protein